MNLAMMNTFLIERAECFQCMLECNYLATVTKIQLLKRNYEHGWCNSPKHTAASKGWGVTLCSPRGSESTAVRTLPPALLASCFLSELVSWTRYQNQNCCRYGKMLVVYSPAVISQFSEVCTAFVFFSDSFCHGDRWVHLIQMKRKKEEHNEMG